MKSGLKQIGYSLLVLLVFVAIFALTLLSWYSGFSPSP